MGSKIIQTQPLRFPAVMILKEIAGINPVLGITYCLDNGRTCLLSESMTIRTPRLHPGSLISSLSINCTNVKEDHLQDIWTNEPTVWLITINKIIASATAFSQWYFLSIHSMNPSSSCARVFSKRNLALKDLLLEILQNLQTSSNILKGNPTRALQEN